MQMRASVIVLGYGAEPHLRDCLSALVAQLGAEDELLLWDNGIDHRIPLEHSLEMRRLGGGTNIGFAGGCNAAAREANGRILIFVNSDAIVRAGAIEALVSAADHPTTGIVSGCLRLADQPEHINSAGNPMHYLGITWAGGCGDPAELHQYDGPVASFSGGLFAVRRRVWEALGGFDHRYFAYHEDADLSLRCWLAGWAVRYVPAAVADHHYDFSRNPRKMYLLERNRLITLLTDYPSALLRTVLPMVLLTEPALLGVAVLQGWATQKVAAWWWLLSHTGALRRRRRAVQGSLTGGVEVLAPLFEARISPPMVTAPRGIGLLNAVLAAYWRLARPWLLAQSRRSCHGP